MSTIIKNGSAIGSSKYTIKSGVRTPTILGTSTMEGTIEVSPGIQLKLQKEIALSEFPLLKVIFYPNEVNSYSYKFLLSINGVQTETINPESENIYPNGVIDSINVPEIRLMRFLGVSDGDTFQTQADSYWHDLLPFNGKFFAVGNRGSKNAIIGSLDGKNWSYASSAASAYCWYRITGNKNSGHLLAVGHNWTAYNPEKAYFYDEDGNSSYENIANMVNTTIQEPGDHLIFSPTKQSQLHFSYSLDNGNIWNSSQFSSSPDMRTAVYGDERYMIFPSGGVTTGYMISEENFFNSVGVYSLPEPARIYCAAFNDSRWLAMQIDKVESQKMFTATTGSPFVVEPSPSGSWYNMIPYKDGFLACSLDGKIAKINADLSFEIIFESEDSMEQWYDLAWGDNTLIVVGGSPENNFRMLITHDLESWIHISTEKRAWHSIIYDDTVTDSPTFITFSYDGNEGGVYKQNYISGLEDDDFITINTRYYKQVNGVQTEVWGLSNTPLIQEDGFRAIQVKSEHKNVNEDSFKPDSIIYANNYKMVTDHLVGLIYSYYNGYPDVAMLDDIQSLKTATPTETDFIGTYERTNLTITNYLTSLLVCLQRLEIYLLSGVDGNIPTILTPFRGKLGSLTFDSFVPNELVLQDKTQEMNYNQILLGKDGILDMLSRI